MDRLKLTPMPTTLNLRGVLKGLSGNDAQFTGYSDLVVSSQGYVLGKLELGMSDLSQSKEFEIYEI